MSLAHITTRAQERIGVALASKGVGRIKWICRRRLGVLIRRVGGCERRLIYATNRTMYCVYDRARDHLVTILPAEALINDLVNIGAEMVEIDALVKGAGA